MRQEIWVHICGQRLHHVQRGNTSGAVDGRLGSARLEEGTTMAEIHVHEFFAKIPASLIGAGNRIIHQTLRLDGVGGGENFFIGRRHTDTGGIKDVLAVEQVLGVRHEGDSHDLAVDGDQLRLGEAAAMLGNKIVKRTSKAVIHQRHKGAVGNDRAGEFRRVGGQSGHLAVLVVLVQVDGNSHAAAITRRCGTGHGLADHGRELFARGVGDFHTERAAEAALDMFTGDHVPDAVFVANDHMAFAVMDVLRGKLGLAIPEDVSVVGYDDVQLAAWPSFDLTTVSQPSDRMVAETVSALMAQIEDGETVPRRVSINGGLVVRGSARRPATAMKE